MTKRYAQGDILLERMAGKAPRPSEAVKVEPDPDGLVVVGRGELSGHRHAVHGNAVLYRAPLESMVGESAGLYVGHLVVADAAGAELRHEEHGTIKLAKGTYYVRRQRRCMGEAVTGRRVAD